MYSPKRKVGKFFEFSPKRKTSSTISLRQVLSKHKWAQNWTENPKAP